MTALFFSALGLMLAGALGAVTASARPRAAAFLGAAGAAGGSAVALAAVVRALFGEPLAFEAAWALPQASFAVGLDAISAAFLAPVCAVALAGSVYAFGYWRDLRGARLAAAWFFFNLLAAAMLLVAAARNAVLFLVAWEIMAVAAFFLITLDHEDADVRSAGWTYLIAAHVGVLILFALFFLLGSRAGSLDFAAFAALAPGPAFGAVLFVLALAGFGLKAALPGMHMWLPDAHAAAPSHVSAMLSGAMLNLGVYGLVRVMSWAGPPAPWWGVTLVVFGITGAVFGIAMAAVQRDIKRVLAYSSIENMGLIVTALGTAVWAHAHGLAATASLAVLAALLHMWNHAAMKGLLFLGAGGLVHATGTRNLERMGGLARRMPVNAALLVFGAAAISGLPPFNGFVSEWLLYMSLAESGLAGGGAAGLMALAGMGFVALTGGIAVLAFVRLCGTALFGSPRSAGAAHAHEPGALLLAPAGALALLCLVSALAPGAPAAALERAAAAVLPGLAYAPPLAPERLGAWNLLIFAALMLGWLLFGRRVRRRPPATAVTWGCGYAAPTPRMQYTARSFTESFADRILPRPLQPESTVSQPQGLFPAAAAFSTRYPEPARDRIFVPLFARIETAMLRLRWIQHGLLHVYVLNVLLFLLGLIVWMSLFAGGGT